jgi:hypothetical protein
VGRFSGHQILSIPDSDPSVAVPNAALVSPAEPARDIPWRWEPRVLVVDDDPVCQLAAQRLFKNLGMAVDTAADADDAVRCNAERHHVAVFMDCASPAVDGYRAARQVRARAGLMNSPRSSASAHSPARSASRRAWTTTSPSR